MIRVIITGPPSGTGWMPYAVKFWWRGGRPQLVGLAKSPLLDACRRLKAYGLMDDTVVGLFYEDDETQWLERTTVGYGATHMPTNVPYREFPGGPIKSVENPSPPPPLPSDAMPATPAAPPPPPRTPPEPPAAADQAHPHPHKPATSAKSHHPPKRAGSGARRGSR